MLDLNEKSTPSSEQWEEFWEGCGFTKISFSDFFGGWIGQYDGVLIHIPDIGSIEFLGFLFKYAVKEDWEIHFYFDKCSQTQDCVVTLSNGKEFDGSGNTRKDALFWAIREVIKK